MRERNKVIYIAGPITGVERYWEAFEKAEDELEAAGFVALNPTRLPKGLTSDQYMYIDQAMIDMADAVFFLPGWKESEGACQEWAYCGKTHTPKYVSIEVLKMKERTT